MINSTPVKENKPAQETVAAVDQTLARSWADLFALKHKKETRKEFEAWLSR